MKWAFLTPRCRPGWASFSHEGPDLEKLWKPRAARWLKNKVKTSSFWRSRSTDDFDLQNKTSSPRFSFQFCTVQAYFVENHCYLWFLKEKKVIRSIQGGSLSLCKCRRARIKGPAGRIWPAGRSLPMSAVDQKQAGKNNSLESFKVFLPSYELETSGTIASRQRV